MTIRELFKLPAGVEPTRGQWEGYRQYLDALPIWTVIAQAETEAKATPLPVEYVLPVYREVIPSPAPLDFVAHAMIRALMAPDQHVPRC